MEKPIEKLNKNNRLFQFIEKFSEIDLEQFVASDDVPRVESFVYCIPTWDIF